LKVIAATCRTAGSVCGVVKNQNPTLHPVGLDQVLEGDCGDLPHRRIHRVLHRHPQQVGQLPRRVLVLRIEKREKPLTNYPGMKSATWPSPHPRRQA